MSRMKPFESGGFPDWFQKLPLVHTRMVINGNIEGISLLYALNKELYKEHFYDLLVFTNQVEMLEKMITLYELGDQKFDPSKAANVQKAICIYHPPQTSAFQLLKDKGCDFSGGIDWKNSTETLNLCEADFENMTPLELFLERIWVSHSVEQIADVLKVLYDDKTLEDLKTVVPDLDNDPVQNGLAEKLKDLNIPVRVGLTKDFESYVIHAFQTPMGEISNYLKKDSQDSDRE